MAHHGQIRAAHKDYSARGSRRAHWFRMLWTGSSWDYFGGRLPAGNFLASDRHATTYGDVEPGDVVCQHNRGGKVDTVYVVLADEDGDVGVEELPYRRRAGKLLVSMPFESEPREYPDPRAS